MNIPSYRPGQRRWSLIETVTLTGAGGKIYEVRAGTTHLAIQLWGGGGGGGGGNSIAGRGFTTYYGGGGGGSGAYTYKILTEEFKKGDIVNFTIGSGGSGGGSGGNGSVGGTTSLDTYVRDEDTLVTYSSINATGGAGGTTFNFSGSPGGSGGASNGGITPSTNGSSGSSGSVGGVDTTSNGGSGGDPPMRSQPLANNGFYLISYVAAGNGSDYSHGGGGGVSGPSVPAPSGGSGANGAIIVTAWGYYPPVPTDPNEV